MIAGGNHSIIQMNGSPTVGFGRFDHSERMPKLSIVNCQLSILNNNSSLTQKPRMDRCPYGASFYCASATEAYIFFFHFPIRYTTKVITMPSVQETISDRNSASGFPWGNSSDRVR